MQPFVQDRRQFMVGASLAALALPAAARASLSQASARKTRHVVLVAFAGGVRTRETFGSPGNVPTLEALAKEGVLYKRVKSSNLGHFGAALSIFTGISEARGIRENARGTDPTLFEYVRKDLGLAAISWFGLIIAIFIGIGLVSKEVERRSVFALLAKPITRGQFILGKYAGLVFTLVVNLSAMTVAFAMVLGYMDAVTVAGVKAGFPSLAATGDQLRTASNAPGAFPASPIAARSLKLSAHSGHQSMSERMYEALIFGYSCIPKSSPKALLPSIRRPAVTNSTSL